MAAAVVVDRGLVEALKEIVAPRLFLRLFKNNAPVIPGSTLADFEICTFPGYLDVELTGLWSAALIDGVGRAYSRIFNVSFTRAAGLGAETVYGWVLYQLPLPDSFLVAGALLSAPVPIALVGQEVVISLIGYQLRG